MQVNNSLGTHVQYRILGGDSSKEHIGIGFIKKNAGMDFENLYSLDFSIIYILSGQGKYVDYKGKFHPLTQGSVFMRLPGIKHTSIIEPGEAWYEMFLAFGSQQCKAFIDMGFINPDQPVGFIGNQPALIDHAWKLLKCMQKAKQDEMYYVFKSISSLLLDMLAINTLGNKVPQSVVRIEEVSNYVSDNLHRRITIDEISHHFGISSTKLRKDFKQLKGISIGSYVIRRRIETSFRYLSDPDISIGEIAEMLGYSNIYDFSNQFKKVTGHSPSRYRKNMI
jgi:AraC-like DNA-binding protein